MLDQPAGEIACHSVLASFSLRVYYLDVSIFGSVIFLRKRHEDMLAGRTIVKFFKRRSCGAQQDFASMYLVHHEGSVAAVVSWSRGVLLIGVVVFLVNDDQSEVMVGQKEG